MSPFRDLFFSGQLALLQGQPDDENRAVVFLAFHKNLPLAQLNDSAHQGQAQAFSCGSVGDIRLIEFIKNMPEVLLPDSNAFIPDPP